MAAQTPVPMTVEQQAAQAKLVLAARVRNGVNWFYWIAGLSIINTIIYTFGGTIAFIIGLGATQFVDGITTGLINELGASVSTILRLAGFGVNIGIAGIFIVAGLLGRKLYRWALIIGMVLYVFDALIFAWFGDWLSLAFHALALWGLWGGLKAMNGLRKLASAQPAAVPFTPVTQELTWYRSDIVRILGGSCGVYVGILVVLAIVGFILTR